VAASNTIASLIQGWGNVRDFGARGDGNGDDAPAFRQALAACSVILVPPGTYRLGSAVTWGDVENTTIRLSPGATFTGAGSLPESEGDNYVITDATPANVDYAEAGDLAALDFGDSASAGVSAKVPRADHVHAMPNEQEIPPVPTLFASYQQPAVANTLVETTIQSASVPFPTGGVPNGLGIHIRQAFTLYNFTATNPVTYTGRVRLEGAAGTVMLAADLAVAPVAFGTRKLLILDGWLMVDPSVEPDPAIEGSISSALTGDAGFTGTAATVATSKIGIRSQTSLAVTWPLGVFLTMQMDTADADASFQPQGGFIEALAEVL
jgi:hypothetical protein